jgi:hypothetical protein
MFFGVLRMPYEMAMSGEISRRQFYSRAQEAADRVEALEAEVARLRAAPAAGTVEKDAERYRHIREAQWFKAGFAKTEANASAFHYCGELLDQLVDAAIEAHNARSPSCGS